MAVLDTDTFARTVANGFGTASDAATWALILGTASTLSVNGSQGVVAYNAGARDLLTLGATTTADGDFIARFIPQTALDFAGFICRYADATDYTRMTLNQGHFLTVTSVVAGVTTNYNISTTATYTNGVAYWVRVRFIGQTFWGKFWQDGAPEPTTWAGTITNTTSPTTAGKYGLYMLSGVSGNSVTVDHLTYSDSGGAEPGVETATGADSATIGVILPGDTATGSENPSVVLPETIPDAAAGGEAASVGFEAQNLVDTGTGSQTVAPTIQISVPQIPLAQDTFAGRSVVGGWGSGSDGQAWGSAGADLSVAGGHGQLAYTTGTVTYFQRYGALQPVDQDVVARFTPGGSGDVIGALLRWTNSSNYYRLRNVAGSLFLQRVVGGVTTTLASLARQYLTAGQAVWLRCRVQGSNLYIRQWNDGTSEPPAWTLTATDNTFSGPGQYGLILSNATPSGVLQVDSFTALDLQASGATGSEAIGIVETEVIADSAHAGDIIAGYALGVGDAATGSDTVSQVATVILPGRLVVTTPYVASNNAINPQLLGNGSYLLGDGDMVIHATIPNGNGDMLGVVLRYQNTLNYLRVVVTGGSALYIPTLGGTDQPATVLSSTGQALAAGQAYWLRVRLVGSQLMHRLWQDTPGAQEPQVWQSFVTVADINLPGLAGLWIGAAAPGSVVNVTPLQVTPASQEVGAATDTYQGSGLPLPGQTAIGSEQISALGVGFALPADTAAGTEQVGLANPVATGSADTAHGSDAPTSVQATIPLGNDQATGSDQVIVVGPIAIGQGDTGAATDTVQITVPVRLNDSATLVETVPALITVTITDSATAGDAINGHASLFTTDTATGSEGLIVGLASAPLNEQATGAESVTLQITPAPPQEIAAGQDAITYLAATLAIQDSATGATLETLQARITLAIPDTATGGEGVSVQVVSVALVEADTAAGSEQISAQATLHTADTATGSDAPTGVQATLTPGPDIATGSEAEQVHATLQAADAATGAESVPGVAAAIPVQDQAAGSEAEQAQASLVIVDTATGGEGLLGPTDQFWVGPGISGATTDRIIIIAIERQ